MKKWVLIVVVGLAATGIASAQFRATTNQNRGSDSNQPVQNKFYFGGGGGFGAGTGYTYYSLFPVMGYRVTPDFSVGTGLNYQRYNYTYVSTGSVAFTQYGISPFLRKNFGSVFFQSEYDLINAPAYNSSNEIVRSNYSRLLFGVGYFMKTGRRGAINALVMYDVLYKPGSVFNSPIVARVFFTF